MCIDALFDPPFGSNPVVGVGSVLLITELLAKPIRSNDHAETDALTYYLSRLDLRAATLAIAYEAMAIAAKYRLKPIDAVHLATAVSMGADRFITNNRRDFKTNEIDEIAVTYPDLLTQPI